MTPEMYDFRVGLVKPAECIKEGWAIIKDDYWLIVGLTLVTMLIGGAVPIVLLGPMMVGLFLCLLEKMGGRRLEFGMLFKGFDYFVPGLIVTVLKVIPFIIIMVPFYIIMFATLAATMPGNSDNPEDAARFMTSFFGVEMVFVLVVMVVSICVEIFFMLAYPLIADRNMSGLDAIKLSFKAGKANFGGILGLLLLNALLTFLGALLCIVGAYFYLPIAFAAQAVAYRRIFPEVRQPFQSPPPPPASWA